GDDLQSIQLFATQCNVLRHATCVARNLTFLHWRNRTFLYCSYNPESDNVFYVNKNAWAASVFRCPRLMLPGWRRKRDDFTLADLEACAKSAMMKRGRAKLILKEVEEAVARWPSFAAEARVPQAQTQAIQTTHRVRSGTGT
ncbi:MAG: hypothetical protein ACI8TX_003756, partial [Hyphomicrobiaceae bacterium]